METYIGFISPFPFNFAPYNWAMCQGQVLSISQNAALFSLLSTTFGGDGVQSFKLPNLGGTMIVGSGTSAIGTPFPYGGRGGAEFTNLTLQQVPSVPHTHPATFTPGGGTSPATLSVSTDTPTTVAPLLANGDTAYLANASVGNNLKGLYTKTAPAPGATATIPVNGGGGSGTVTVNPNTPAPATAPVALMNPYLALNFCIALQGIFPSRN
ncbi:MAG: tail fiber protein [Sulfuricellaceae bacterium]|nr:tail fiber protein [Sulfuricellaceae bacterium]